ncbi:MAG: serine/threonine-protein kinase [Bryobacteraceae bacterium]
MVGRTVAQYQLTEKLGAGGMGEIYKAQDTRLGRTVAVKVLPSAKSGDPERRKRFLIEAQAASGLNHPSIVTIHDVLSDGDTEFMVMEYVAGKTLNDLIPKGGLRVPQVLKYALQLSDALSVAHGAGIVHRDLKPANVMVTDSGLVKVLDFGLAKMSDRNPVTQLGEEAETIAASAPLTVEGSIIGTVSYMAPEQAQGKKVDSRSDIFSFGAVLYEMCTGRRAFEGESSLSTLSAILRDDVKPMIEVAPDVPPQLELVIQQCLKKNPDDRWQTMKEVQAALSSLKRESDSGSLYTSRISPPPGGVSIPPATTATAAAVAAGNTPPKKSGAMVSIAMAALIVVGGGGGAWWYMQQQAAEKAAKVAQDAAATAAAQAAAEAELERKQAEELAAAAEKETLTNDGVIELIKEKIPINLILDHIRASKFTKFDLSTGELIRLTKGSVPGVVIDQMRDPKKVVPYTRPAPAANASAKQTPAPAPVTTTAPLTALAPVSVPIASTPAAAPVPIPAPAPTPAPAPAAQMVTVSVNDGTPFRMQLSTDIPADADLSRPVKFLVQEDFSVQGVVLLHRGAAVYGEISETAKKKKLFGISSGKLSFTLSKADSAGGQQINVRALAARRSDGAAQRPVEVTGKSGNKDVAAARGTEYIGYIDGTQSVSVPK